MFKMPIPLFCICSHPWKKCVNKKWHKQLNKEAWYDIPYTIGSAELGYEYDFLQNKKIKCLKDKYYMPWFRFT